MTTYNFFLISESSHIDNQQHTVIRKLEIHQISTSEKRIITQYHYRKWPDFGVPEGKEVNSFLKLVNLVNLENPSSNGKGIFVIAFSIFIMYF